MQYEAYDIVSNNDLSVFEFISEGKNGVIKKRIKFQQNLIPHLANLTFGDVNENDEVDDHSISNNGDRNKILATIASAVEDYSIKYPDRWIYIRGSTRQRTRLYRMAISINFDELKEKFHIYIENADGMMPFEKNIPVEGILVKRKIQFCIWRNKLDNISFGPSYLNARSP